MLAILKYNVYSDLPGWEALCVTNLKSDIVKVEKHKKVKHMNKLTCPPNMNIDIRNKEKTQKYTPSITDITGFKCELNCFEVSSTGFISTRNKATLQNLYKLIRKGIKKIHIFGPSQLLGMVWFI